MTAANATKEAKREKRDLRIPYWWTLKAEGSLNEKFPGGGKSQKEMLEREGFWVIEKGKKRRVEDYREHVIEGF